MKRFVPSARERELLYGYARGDTHRVIAAVLGIKPSHAGTLGMRMRTRMGAKSQAHAVAIAYELGILTMGGAS